MDMGKFTISLENLKTASHQILEVNLIFQDLCTGVNG